MGFHGRIRNPTPQFRIPNLSLRVLFLISLLIPAIRAAALEIVAEIVAATAVTVAAACIGATSAFLAAVVRMIIVPILFRASVGRLTHCFIDACRLESVPIVATAAPTI
jgi:hypothetical protein